MSRAVSWKGKHPPNKILVMRFQALGDTVITLPYLQGLKSAYPQVELHFLTREEVSAIPRSVGIFDKILAIGGGRNLKLQFALALLKMPLLWMQGYDAVLDLQNHRISRIIRKFLFVNAFAEFEIDRRTTRSAGERTKQTIEALWSWKIDLEPHFTIQNPSEVDALLKENGWNPKNNLVVLNPAGFFPSRSWPLKNYIDMARLWLKNIDSHTQFVLLLLPSLREKSKYIKEGLGDACIDLTGKANQVEAFAIIQKCTMVISEDSGLMHMSWVQKVPTVALFSSSRKDWSGPQGFWSVCLDSSDLECGACMQEFCKFNDNRCLTRYSPEFVVKHCAEVLHHMQSPIFNL